MIFAKLHISELKRLKALFQIRIPSLPFPMTLSNAYSSCPRLSECPSVPAKEVHSATRVLWPSALYSLKICKHATLKKTQSHAWQWFRAMLCVPIQAGIVVRTVKCQ